MSDQGTSFAKRWNGWFWETSKLVGAPLLVTLVFQGVQLFVFTFTCNAAGYRCDKAFGAVPSNVEFSIPGFERNTDEEEIREPLRRR